MAAWDYDSLKEKLADWLPDDDISTGVDDIIDMAEDRLSRRLAHYRQIETVEDTIADTDEVDIPDDFVQPIVFYLDTTPKVVLTYIPDAMLRAGESLYESGDSPEAYTIEGDKFILLPSAPIAGTDYVLKYYKRLPGLASNDTNWLLESHRDVYLYACLVEAMVYLLDNEREQLYENVLAQRITEVNGLTARAKHRHTAQVVQRLGGAKVV